MAKLVHIYGLQVLQLGIPSRCIRYVRLNHDDGYVDARRLRRHKRKLYGRRGKP